MTVISRTPYDGRYMSGVVTQLNGTVGEKRGILLRYARTPDAEKRLKRAADDAPVVKVRTFYGEYSLPAHEFLIVLGTRDYARLRVDAEQARQASYQNLKDRAQAVAAAADTLKAMDYIGDSYKSNTTERFWRAADVDFAATVMLGDGDARAYRPRKLWAALKQVGMFSAGEVARPVRIGVINALGEPPPGNFDGQLIEALAALNIPVANVQQTLTSGLTPDEAAAAFGQLDAPDAVIVIIPGKEPTRYSQEDDWAAYVNIKRAVLKAGVPSLCVFERDMRGAASVHEHALAFALAVGYIPYALGAPLPFTDMVVGLTVLRTADPLLMASVYGADGVFIGYTLAAGELSTETATRLLPATFFEGARVVLHTDDGLTDDEAVTLRDYAGQHDITLFVTTVGAASNPRLYAFTGRGVAQPPTGTAFRLSERAALLIPALPPHPAMPPNPLHITTDDALPPGGGAAGGAGNERVASAGKKAAFAGDVALRRARAATAGGGGWLRWHGRGSYRGGYSGQINPWVQLGVLGGTICTVLFRIEAGRQYHWIYLSIKVNSFSSSTAFQPYRAASRPRRTRR